MRLCTKCNRLLKSTDTYCPYCAGEVTADRPADESKPAATPKKNPVPPAAPAKPVFSYTKDKPATPPDAQVAATPVAEKPFAEQPASTPRRNALLDEVEAQAITMEIPLPHAEPSDAAQAPVDDGIPDIPVTAFQDIAPLDEQLEPQGVTMEIALDKAEPGNPALYQDYDEDSDFTEDTLSDLGFIERQLDAYGDEEDETDDKRAPLGKLGITLIVILALAAVVFGVLLVRKWNAPAATNENFAALVQGQWISANYTFVDDTETGSFSDYLVLNSDGTFVFQILVPNSAIPDGYKNGEWEVFNEHTGTYEIDADSGTLSLFYDADDPALYYRYEIVDITQKSMTLREYYNEQGTEFFDLSYTKVS